MKITDLSEDYFISPQLINNSSTCNLSSLSNRLQESYSSVRKHRCLICNKTFQRPAELLRHIRIHTGEKPFVCNICNRGFKQHAFITEKTFYTEERFSTYPSNSREVQNQQNFTGTNSFHSFKKGPKQHNCPFCIKAFIRTTDLERHIRVHTGEKPYECHVCKKAYRQSSALKSHFYRIHASRKLQLE